MNKEQMNKEKIVDINSIIPKVVLMKSYLKQDLLNI